LIFESVKKIITGTLPIQVNGKIKPEINPDINFALLFFDKSRFRL